MSIGDFFKGIGSIASFKSSLKEVFNVQTLLVVQEYAKEQIKKQVTKKIPGPEKMEEVTNNVKAFIKEHVNSKNKLVQYLIDLFVEHGLPAILQSIYDDLKTYVKGLTKV